MRRWFLPQEPDLLGLLRAQTDVTVEGMRAFQTWAHGDASAAASVRDAEHRADDAKRALQAELRAAFSTPLDAEDIYELSERLDDVIGGAKDLVREADALALASDPALAAMADVLVSGLGHLAEGFAALPKGVDAATAAADAAKREARRIEPLYGAAMSATLQLDDPRQQFPRRELYRRVAQIADAMIRVAERVWYAVVKQS